MFKNKVLYFTRKMADVVIVKADRVNTVAPASWCTGLDSTN